MGSGVGVSPCPFEASDGFSDGESTRGLGEADFSAAVLDDLLRLLMLASRLRASGERRLWGLLPRHVLKRTVVSVMKALDGVVEDTTRILTGGP